MSAGNPACRSAVARVRGTAASNLPTCSMRALTLSRMLRKCLDVRKHSDANVQLQLLLSVRNLIGLGKEPHNMLLLPLKSHW